MHYFILILAISAVSANEPRIHSNQDCQNDGDCKENSFCFGNDVDKRGRCKCSVGFILFDNVTMYECSKPIESIGSACVFDDQCEFVLGVDSECDAKNICRCLPSAHFVLDKNACYKTSHVDEFCDSTENCFPMGQFHCTFGKCSCPLNHHITPENRCVKSLHLGDICEYDDSCLHMNAVCRVNCQCRVGYVVADGQHNCLKAVTTLGDSCDQLSQCTKYLRDSVCLDGKCKCASDFHQYGNMCYKSKNIGESCESKNECVIAPKLDKLVDCQSNVCTCRYGTQVKDSCNERSATDYIRKTDAYIFAAILFLIV